MKKTVTLICLAASAFAIVVYLQLNSPSPPSHDAAPSIHPAELNPMQRASERMATASLPLPAQNSIAPIESGLTSQLSALIATGDAKSLLEAHKLVWQCIELRRQAKDLVGNSFPESVKQTRAKQLKECNDVAPSYERDYLDWLRLANQKKIPGASVQTLLTGPDGDITSLTQRPDDPLVQEWRKTTYEALLRDARSGDNQALISLSTAYGNGTFAPVDPKVEAGFELALMASQEKNKRKITSYQRKYLEQKIGRLNEADQAWAKEFAASIVN